MNDHNKPKMDAPLPDPREFHRLLNNTGLPPGPIDRTMDIALGTTAEKLVPAKKKE